MNSKSKYRRWNTLKVGKLYMLYFVCGGERFTDFIGRFSHAWDKHENPGYWLRDTKGNSLNKWWTPVKEYTPVIVVTKRNEYVRLLLNENFIHVNDQDSDWGEEEHVDWEARFCSIQ